MMRSLSDPATADQYRPILRDIDRLVEYLTRMANVLDDADDEAIRLSKELGGMIQDDTAWTNFVTNDTLML